MSHYYDCSSSPKLTSARTPSQAKKINAYPSVTTILGIQMEDYLHNIWIPQKICDLARQHPEATSKQIMDIKYGFRTSPVDGMPIRSNEFGTAVHARLEDVLNNRITGEGLEENETAWDGWVEPFIDFVDKNDIEIVECEKIAYSDKERSAGSIDLVAKHKGKYHLFDYKCRDTKGSGGKFYEKKDCSQLAIESMWIKEEFNLNYFPAITSVCICTETQKHYHKDWSKAQLRKGIKRFRLLRQLYYMDWMNE